MVAEAPGVHADEASSDLTRPSPIARILLALIGLYRATAALRSPRCRFLPTCSAYAAESIEVHGPGRGTWLALRRIGRCHPWNPGGVDAVPPPSPERQRRSRTRK